MPFPCVPVLKDALGYKLTDHCADKGREDAPVSPMLFRNVALSGRRYSDAFTAVRTKYVCTGASVASYAWLAACKWSALLTYFPACGLAGMRLLFSTAAIPSLS